LTVRARLLQAGLDFAIDGRGRQRQRDAALELLEGFDVDGHDVSVKGWESDGWCAGPDSNRHAGEGVRT
jgi:hypothetical protein